MNKRIRCSCGATVLPSYYEKHKLTKKHKDNMEYETDDEVVTDEESKTFFEENGLKITEKITYTGDRDMVGKVDSEEHLNSCGCDVL